MRSFEIKNKICGPIRQTTYDIPIQEIQTTSKDVVFSFQIANLSLAEKQGKANCCGLLVILKDCGHVPIMERPEESASHYAAFIKQYGLSSITDKN